jgi:hypothetical protein
MRVFGRRAFVFAAVIVRFAALGMVTSILVAWTSAMFIRCPADIRLLSWGKEAKIARVFVQSVRGSPYIEMIDPPAPPVSDTSIRSVRVQHWRRFGSSYFDARTAPAYHNPFEHLSSFSETVPFHMRSRATPWLTKHAPFPVGIEYRTTGARGWPMLCLWCEFTVWPTPSTTLPMTGQPIGGIALPWPRVTPVSFVPPQPVTSLPYRPLPLGLAANTAFYAGLWWLVLIARGRLRRARRLRKGLCPSCTYDRRGIAASSPCPECGTPSRLVPGA